MGSIYSKAEQVLVCIGPHANGSQLLLQIAREMSEIVATQPSRSEKAHDEAWDKGGRDWNPWLSCFREDFRETLRCALEDMCGREYWTRLWVLQEVALASAVEFFCGSDVLTKDEVLLLTELVKDTQMKIRAGLWSIPTRDPHVELMRTTVTLDAAARKLGDVIDITWEHRCEGPRDHVYGMLCLVEKRKIPIVPDYSRSNIEVAVDVIPEFDEISEIDHFFGLLDIDYSEMHVVGVGSSPLAQSNPHNCAPRTPWEQLGRSLTINVGYPTIPRVCTRIDGMDGSGRLTAMIRLDDDSWLGAETVNGDAKRLLGMCEEMCEKMSPNELRPKYLNSNGTIAGVVCSNAAVGDIMVPITTPMRFFRYGIVFLVVRHNEREHFDVVDQGFLMLGYNFFYVEPQRRQIGRRDGRNGLGIQSKNATHGYSR